MSKRAKLIASIRNNPSNVRFADLLSLLAALGFKQVRQAGSHKQFKSVDHPEVHLTLQQSSGMAKPYQVRQVLAVVDAMESK
jgi:predicted RNA binding protein YcfA (HicA-like mRNA interferase family)